MSLGLQQFMVEYNLDVPPPSYLVLYENMNLYTTSIVPGASQSNLFLQKVFGRNIASQQFVDWNGDGVPDGPGGNATLPWILEGEQCLVFYLGGIPSAPGLGGYSPQGFSTSNTNPAQPVTTSPKRKGPYYQFQVARLAPQPYNALVSPFPSYIDAWQAKANPQPYAYFSSNGAGSSATLKTGYFANNLLDCASIKAAPYFITGTNPPQFMNSNTFQIISAGKDGVFGTTGWYPASGMPPVPTSNPNASGQPAGADDQANFSTGLLGSGQS
jgi:general secretion pathway protein G